MKEFIEFIVKHLVDHPEAVEIQEHPPQYGKILFVVKVDPSDIGKVVGKQGKNAFALRTLLTAVSARMRKRVHVEIYDAKLNS